ncbi:MAG: hypothetical protein IKC38_02245 [Clostridia bacterium]|nr:hypothetical protein [Clostridia bacterium]
MTEILNMLRALDGMAYGIIAAILIIFAVTIISGVKVRAGYALIRMKLRNKDYRRDGNFQSEFINGVVDDYTVGVSVNGGDINTSVLVDKCIQKDLRGLLSGERFIKSAGSAMIILGLMGTFLGLTQSVGSISGFFQTGEDISSIFQNAGEGIMEALSGMGTAFTTSLVGVFCSIIVTISGVASRAEEARLSMITELEDYLDNTLFSMVADEYKCNDTRTYVAVSKALDEFLEKLKPSARVKSTNLLSIPGKTQEPPVQANTPIMHHTSFAIRQERRVSSEENNQATVEN